MSHFLWWLIGFAGVGGTIAIVAGFLIGWPVVIQFFIGTKIGRMLALIGAAVLAIGFALLKARSQGAAAERQRQKDENDAFLKEQAKRDAVIRGSTDAALDDRLREHPRKPGARP